jgi:superfamily I DNA/RNA helicase
MTTMRTAEEQSQNGKLQGKETATEQSGEDLSELQKKYQMLMEHTPSKDQARIFDWVENGSGNAFVESVAGSGKTATIVASAQLMDERERNLMCAFNTVIQQELAESMAELPVHVRTIHSIGKEMIEAELEVEVEPKWWKPDKVVKEVVADWDIDDGDYYARKSLKEMIDIARKTLTDPGDEESLKKTAEHYGVQWFDFFPDAVAHGMYVHSETVKEAGIVDFTDMVYLPLAWGVAQNWEDYDWVFVDEAQDLNACQRRLVQEIVAENGRSMYVGDRHQAIYGFNGADTQSVKRIIKETEAETLPLTICYRCPKSHIERAQAIVPEIEPAPGAEEGIFTARLEENLPELVREGDLILSRRSDPLITWCTRLIQNRISAYVRGADLSSKVKDDIREVKKALQKKGTTRTGTGAIANKTSGRGANGEGRGGTETAEGMRSGIVGTASVPEGVRENEEETFQEVFLRELEASGLRRRKKMIKEGKDRKRITQLGDRIKAIKSVVESFPVESIEDVFERVNQIFQETDRSVELSTVHKAKGREASRVFLLRPEDMPLRFGGEEPWEMEQEMNLKYVALTRATESVIVLVKENVLGMERRSGYFDKLNMASAERGDRFVHKMYGPGTLEAIQPARWEEGEPPYAILTFDQHGMRKVDATEKVFQPVDEKNKS